MRRLALALCIVTTAGCGGRTHADQVGVDAATGGMEAGVPVEDGSLGFYVPDVSAPPEIDAAIDVGAPVDCEGGFFIELTDDSGTWRASDNCEDGGPPEIHSALCAEDYGCSWIAGCGGDRYVTIVTGVDLAVGFTGGQVRYGQISGGMMSDVNASIRITSFPSDGGTVAGDYDGSALGAVGGSAPSGSFCVVRAGP